MQSDPSPPDAIAVLKLYQAFRSAEKAGSPPANWRPPAPIAAEPGEALLQVFRVRFRRLAVLLLTPIAVLGKRLSRLRVLGVSR